MNGFFVIDKPEGITSHDVVGLFRAVTGEKKVGHTGTLDPFATGVLAVAVGSGTRAIALLDESLKVYDATIALGTSTDTGDLTGEVIRTAEVPALEASAVHAVLAQFTGEQMQKPPAYSAVKFQGKPLYWYARRGEVVDVPAKPITVYALRLISLAPAEIRVEIRCSKGTYARVLADDIATALGTAGHLSKLSRTQSGPFHIERALTVQQIADMASGDPEKSWQDVFFKRGDGRVKWRPRADVLTALQPWRMNLVEAFRHLPLVDVTNEEARKILQGQIPSRLPGGLALGGHYALASGTEVLAIAEASPAGAKLTKVLPQF